MLAGATGRVVEKDRILGEWVAWVGRRGGGAPSFMEVKRL